MTAETATEFLHSQQFIDDPDAFFRMLRRDAPVCPVRTRSGMPVWLVSRDADVRRLLGDERIVMTGAYAAGASGARNALDRNLLDLDGDEHAAVRRLAAGALSARAVQRRRPGIHQLIARRADTLTPDRPTELITAFIRPALLASTCSVLGVSEEDWADIERWVRALLSPGTSTLGIETALEALEPYLARLVSARRADPRDDIVSAAVAAADKNGEVSEADLVSLCGMLVIAGFENTGRTIANALLWLARRPGEWERYVAAAEAERQPLFEDLIRLCLPEPLSSVRVATEAVEVAGHVVQPGERLMFAFGAANRDVARYREPDALAPRDNAQDHLSFGKGAHFCLGAALARLQIETTLAVLAERFLAIRLADPSSVRWTGTYRHRELHRLDVVLHSTPRK
ncbi:cytochrome P450 [Streptomyces sp. NPDC002446]